MYTLKNLSGCSGEVDGRGMGVGSVSLCLSASLILVCPCLCLPSHPHEHWPWLQGSRTEMREPVSRVCEAVVWQKVKGISGDFQIHGQGVLK